MDYKTYGSQRGDILLFVVGIFFVVGMGFLVVDLLSTYVTINNCLNTQYKYVFCEIKDQTLLTNYFVLVMLCLTINDGVNMDITRHN